MILDRIDPKSAEQGCERQNRTIRAFSNEVDTGSREENASKQKPRALALISSKPERL
jgi:hypothetical protein